LARSVTDVGPLIPAGPAPKPVIGGVVTTAQRTKCARAAQEHAHKRPGRLGDELRSRLLRRPSEASESRPVGSPDRGPSGSEAHLRRPDRAGPSRPTSVGRGVVAAHKNAGRETFRGRYRRRNAPPGRCAGARAPAVAQDCLEEMRRRTAARVADEDVLAANEADAEAVKWQLERRLDSLNDDAGSLCFGRIDDEADERW